MAKIAYSNITKHFMRESELRRFRNGTTTMAEFEMHYRTDGLFEVDVKGSFKDEDVTYLGQVLRDAYNPSHANYNLVDLSDNHVLPLRILGGEILRIHRDMADGAPMFIALVVQASIAQVLGSVLKTLMRREEVQAFTDVKLAMQWLALERKKQSV